MNSRSKLDISQSSLLSLKAELARKHEEATKAKAQAQGSFIKPLAKPSKNSIFSRPNLGTHQNNKKELSAEEESKLQESRSALEEKAKLYDSLSQKTSSEGCSEYLVNFAEKSSDSFCLDQSEVEEEEERRRREKEEEEEEARRADSDEYDIPSDPEDDWVDFRDSLGRTRRCLRRDLARFKELDDRLLKSLEPKAPPESKDEHAFKTLPSAGFPSGCAAPDLLSDDMRREQQRLKWEEEEEKLRSKSEIHYQDVLFDEARTHGVGFFAFARDEATRRAQQDDMRKLRRETEAKQKAALSRRDRRQQLMEARLRAAHNRKRAREGLPPLAEDEPLPGDKKDEEPEQPEEPAAAAPTVQRASGPRPRPSPSVRPWDVGKEGVPVLSQSEWNDQQRAERKKEFAPPSFYEDRRGEPSERQQHAEKRRRPADADKRRAEGKRAAKADSDDDDDLVGPRPPRDSDSPPPGPAPPPPPPAAAAQAEAAWMRVPPPMPPFMPPVHLPPPNMAWPPQPVPPPVLPPVPPPAQPPVPGVDDDLVPDATRGGLFFTSKKPRRDWRAQQQAQEVRLPMEEEEDFTAAEPPPPGVTDSPPAAPPAARDRDKDRRRGVGAEIAPPPTLEYFGPGEAAAERSRRAAQAQGRAQGRNPDDLSASITAGLRFLRNQTEEKERRRTDKGWADFVG